MNDQSQSLEKELALAQTEFSVQAAALVQQLELKDAMALPVSVGVLLANARLALDRMQRVRDLAVQTALVSREEHWKVEEAIKP